jgi:hypothetical protein
LRRRVPQYGHSVTYGLTSAPQFLQTTLSSGDEDSIPLESIAQPRAPGSGVPRPGSSLRSL